MLYLKELNKKSSKELPKDILKLVNTIVKNSEGKYINLITTWNHQKLVGYIIEEIDDDYIDLEEEYNKFESLEDSFCFSWKTMKKYNIEYLFFDFLFGQYGINYNIPSEFFDKQEELAEIIFSKMEELFAIYDVEIINTKYGLTCSYNREMILLDFEDHDILNEKNYYSRIVEAFYKEDYETVARKSKNLLEERVLNYLKKNKKERMINKKDDILKIFKKEINNNLETCEFGNQIKESVNALFKMMDNINSFRNYAGDNHHQDKNKKVLKYEAQFFINQIVTICELLKYIQINDN